MSFIVKGIDLPKDGESIRLEITSSGDVIEVWSSGLAKAYHPCQAIQIPKNHGRLIDADELIEHMSKDPLYYLVEIYGVSGVIKSRPTILEEEE